MIQGKMIQGRDDLSQVYKIRKEVFVEEQGIDESLEFDDADQEAIHVLVYEGMDASKAVATGRIIYNGETCLIGRIAVRKKYRGKKYGDFAVRMLLNKAFTSGIDTVYVNAQVKAKGFYEKIGFKEIGHEFIEAGIVHIKMQIQENQVSTYCNRKH